MELSKRLQAVANEVPQGAVIADIGTDHAYIPIYLVKNNIVDTAIAMDVNKGPIQRATDNIKNYGLDGKITARQSDGLKELREDEVNVIVIAGMGGGLVNRILEEGKHLLPSIEHLILQPQSEIDEVRKQIHKLEYKIINENMIIDEGKYYTIIKAIKGIELYTDTKHYKYGKILIEAKHPTLKEFLEKELNNLTRIKEDISNNNSEKAIERTKELTIEISEIKEVLECL